MRQAFVGVWYPVVVDGQNTRLHLHAEFPDTFDIEPFESLPALFQPPAVDHSSEDLYIGAEQLIGDVDLIWDYVPFFSFRSLDNEDPVAFAFATWTYEGDMRYKTFAFMRDPTTPFMYVMCFIVYEDGKTDQDTRIYVKAE